MSCSRSVWGMKQRRRARGCNCDTIQRAAAAPRADHAGACTGHVWGRAVVTSRGARPAASRARRRPSCPAWTPGHRAACRAERQPAPPPPPVSSPATSQRSLGAEGAAVRPLVADTVGRHTVETGGCQHTDTHVGGRQRRVSQTHSRMASRNCHQTIKAGRHGNLRTGCYVVRRGKFTTHRGSCPTPHAAARSTAARRRACRRRMRRHARCVAPRPCPRPAHVCRISGCLWCMRCECTAGCEWVVLPLNEAGVL